MQSGQAQINEVRFQSSQLNLDNMYIGMANLDYLIAVLELHSTSTQSYSALQIESNHINDWRVKNHMNGFDVKIQEKGFLWQPSHLFGIQKSQYGHH